MRVIVERHQHLIQHHVVQHRDPPPASAVQRSAPRDGSTVRSARPVPTGRGNAAPPRPPRRARREASGVQCIGSRSAPAGRYAAVIDMGAGQRGGISHQRDAAIIRHIEPLVRVGRPRVRSLDTADEVRACRRRQPTDRTRRRRGPRRRTPAAAQTSPTGSKAPVFTLPACTQTIEDAVNDGNSEARRRPCASTGTRTTSSRPSPSSATAFNAEACTSSPTTT